MASSGAPGPQRHVPQHSVNVGARPGALDLGGIGWLRRLVPPPSVSLPKAAQVRALALAATGLVMAASAYGPWVTRTPESGQTSTLSTGMDHLLRALGLDAPCVVWGVLTLALGLALCTVGTLRTLGLLSWRWAGMTYVALGALAAGVSGNDLREILTVQDERDWSIGPGLGLITTVALAILAVTLGVVGLVRRS